MSPCKARDGGCQCGQLRYRVSGEPLRIGICYCSECQHHSGSAFSLNMILRVGDFTITRGTVKRFSRTADSGRPVECAFCPDCGTRIFHVPSYLDNVVNVKPGTLDDASGLSPTIELFAARKPAWLSVSGLSESRQHQDV